MKTKDITVLDIVSEFNDFQIMSESIDTELRSIENIDVTINKIQNIVDYIAKEGYTEPICNVITKFEGLEDLVGLTAEKIIKYQATEGIADSVKAAAKKFWEGVKSVISKIIEFFKKLFNAAEYKCRAICLNINNINWDKKVSQFTSDEYHEIASILRDLQTRFESIMKNVMTIGGEYQSQKSKSKEELIEDIIFVGQGVLTNNNGTISFNPEKVKLDSMTLRDAGWTPAEIKNVCNSYISNIKNISELGHKFMQMLVVAANTFVNKDLGVLSNEYRDEIKIDTTIYNIFAKFKALTVKQINAFYSCINKHSEK